MRTSKCLACAFTFSEADKAWDAAIDSGRCPNCSEPLRDFPVPAKEQKGKPATSVGPIGDDKISNAYQQAASPLAKNWKQVTAEEAKRHSLYGVRGWLAVFAFGVPLDFLKAVVIVNAEALKIGMTAGKLLSVNMPSIIFLRSVLALQLLAIIIIYWLLFARHKHFRPVTICILLGLWPAIALLGVMNPFSEITNMVALSFFPWAISCAVWVTYLQRSKRVRVTFEHTVEETPNKVGEVGAAPSHFKAKDVLAAALPIGATQENTGQELETNNLDRTTGSAWDQQFHYTSPGTDTEENLSEVSKAAPSSKPIPDTIVPPVVAVESNQPSAQELEDRLYEQIARELETNTVEKGLWTKAYAQAGGDDKQTRVLYIKARFDRLIAVENARLEAIRMAPILEREKRIKKCESLLASKGYRLIPKQDGWVVKEPLGGMLPITTLEDLERYANSRQKP